MLSDYLFYKASKNKIPLQGTFELSPVCNFSCKMCYVRKTKKQVEEEGKHIRTWEEWLELGRQCKEAGMLYCLLTGGEPFLYPNFRLLYEGLHKMGIVIKINSNGTLIDEETITWLKTMAPSRINITLYGSKPETYENLCGDREGYNKAKKAILLLKEAGITVVINVSMIPENADDLEEIFAFGKKHGIETKMATYMFPPVRREVETSDSRFTPIESALMMVRRIKCTVSPKQHLDVYKKMLDKVGNNERDDESSWGNNLDHMCCRAGRSTFWVSWDGTMTACGMFPFPLQVYPFEKPFIECWTSLNEKVRNAKVMEACSSCEKRELCHPCTAQVYSETGNVNAKARYLCESTDYLIKELKSEILRIEEELDND